MDIPVIRLGHGMGSPGTSHCVMAACSIISGEEFTDAPQCACPVITQVMISLNDSYPEDCEQADADRERDLGIFPWLVIGTRSPDRRVAYDRLIALRRFARERGVLLNAIGKRGNVSIETEYTAARIIHTGHRDELIEFVRDVLIPMYTEMPEEPDYSFRHENLILA